MTSLGSQAMREIHELQAHVEALESHVARLEGIVQALLEEAAAGRLQASADQILSALPRLEADH